MAVITSSRSGRLVTPEATEEIQEHGACRRWWVQKMRQFLDTKKKCCYKNYIREAIRVPGLPTNTSVANNEASFSLVHQPNFRQRGPRDPEEEGGGRRHLLQTFPCSGLSHTGPPPTGGGVLPLLCWDTLQACLVSQWAPSISMTSPFLSYKTLIPFWQLENDLTELIGSSLCLTGHPYTCLLSMFAFKFFFSKLCPVGRL